MVARLLQAGADANAAQASGETALMTCARSGVSAAVEPLLAGGADVNAAEAANGQTALMWAAWEGHTDVVRALLAHGANADARTTTGYTALLLAAREGYADTTRTLLDAGADVNAAAEDGTTALLVAVIRRNLEYADLLLSHGADPDLGPGFTPLHWAAGKWDTELNDLSNGVVEGNQWSAFGGLLEPDRLHMVRKLLAHGADPNIRTLRTPGFGIQVKGHLGNMKGATAFLIAAKANDLAVMRELLENGADPLEPTDNGTTPLMVAAGVGHAPGITRSAEDEALRAVTLCVELGADVNAVERAGRHGAARRRVARAGRLHRAASWWSAAPSSTRRTTATGRRWSSPRASTPAATTSSPTPRPRCCASSGRLPVRPTSCGSRKRGRGGRGKSPAAFDRPCIPPDCVVPRSHTRKYARSSRLVSRAPDRSRCDAGSCHGLLAAAWQSIGASSLPPPRPRPSAPGWAPASPARHFFPELPRSRARAAALRTWSWSAPARSVSGPLSTCSGSAPG